MRSGLLTFKKALISTRVLISTTQYIYWDFDEKNGRSTDSFAHWHKTNSDCFVRAFFCRILPLQHSWWVHNRPFRGFSLGKRSFAPPLSVQSFYSMNSLARCNPRIFIATLSFAAKAFSILNKGPNHLKSKLWNFNPILFLKLLSLIFQHFLLIKLHIRSDEGKR